MTDPTVRYRTVRGGRPSATGPIGQPVQNPLGDLEMSAETALYVGLLEGQLAAYAVNEVKYRVLLELITGESWYSTRVSVETDVLADLATDALVRRGMDGTAARTVVNKRLSFGVTDENMPVMPEAQQIGESGDLATRFERWKERRDERGGLHHRKPTAGPTEIESQDSIPNEQPEESKDVAPQENSSEKSPE